MNTRYTLFTCMTAAFAVCMATSVPQVETVTMEQSGPGRLVRIDYTFKDADAVITLDIQTNCTENGEVRWASIGGEAVRNATGEVWRKVQNDGSVHHIEWRPDISWPDHIVAEGGARAVVTAWTLDNTPDYMVVDISAAAQPNTQRYYPSVEYLPGGILSNQNYRTTKIVMRKIMAKDVEWTMGSTVLEGNKPAYIPAAAEITHQVMLTNNYYIGVFPVTQEQWGLVQTARPTPSAFYNPADRAMRPVEQVSYNEIRNAANVSSANTAYYYPENPNPGSFLGLLRTKTGLDFDLPSEAQWEFAARAGNGDTKWGDGSGILNADRDGNLAEIGRYLYNGGKAGPNSDIFPSWDCGATNATAIVGSYRPNSWGIYDMNGNVWEWCLDWYKEDITSLTGAVNTVVGSYRVTKGGAFNCTATLCRSAFRYGLYEPNVRSYSFVGFRLVCCGGLR